MAIFPYVENQFFRKLIIYRLSDYCNFYSKHFLVKILFQCIKMKYSVYFLLIKLVTISIEIISILNI